MIGTYETYDERIIKHRRVMRERDCPSCGAAKGETCRWDLGPYMHPSRLQATWEKDTVVITVSPRLAAAIAATPEGPSYAARLAANLESGMEEKLQ